MNSEKRIPLAWSARWRRIRLQAVPIACFLLALGTSGWLWQLQGSTVRSVGEVDALRIDVTSPAAGLVVALPHQTGRQWNLYDHVLADEVIAQFDDGPLETEKNLLRHDVKQLRNEISRWQTELADHRDAAVRNAALAAAEQEQSRLAEMEQALGVVSDAPLDAGELRSAPPELPETAPAAIRSELAVFGAARRGLQLRWETIEHQAAMLMVRAPITGTLVAVYCWPGQTVPPGGRIATIAADYGRHIVSYMPEESPVAPRPGMRVTLRSRFDRSRQVTTQIEEVGRQIERVPARYLANPTVRQWGIPVRINLPSEATFAPGALVDVIFHTTG